MKTNIKKAVALMLSLIFVLTTFAALPFTANAASEHIDITLIDYPRGGGTTTWGHPALTLMNGWSLHETFHFSAKAAVNKGMQVAYCVQPSAPLYSGDQSPEILPTNFLDTYDNGALTSADIQRLIGRIFQYGFTGTVTDHHTNDEISNMIASQVLVWEVIVGERDYDFSKIKPPVGIDECLESVKSEHPLRSEILAHYNRIATSVINHSKLPSFMKAYSSVATVHELTWDGSTYSLILTDVNNVLQNYTFSSNTSSVKFSVSANKLTISTDAPPSGNIEIHATKSGMKRSAITFWASGVIKNKNQVQGLTMSGQEISDPIEGYVKAKVSTGNLQIVKLTQNNNGNVSGFTFEVKRSDGTPVGTYTSGSSGQLMIENLPAGNYVVYETNLSDEFVTPAPNPVNITVYAGQTANVTFTNIKKQGVIVVEKSNLEPAYGTYSLAGAEFGVYQGSTLVATIVTDATGRGESKVLPLSSYTVKETKAPYGFILDPTTYFANLTGSLGTAAIVYKTVGIGEKVAKGKVIIDKSNAEPEYGDYSLKDAIFDVTLNGTVVDSIYTDSSGHGESKLLPLNSGYKVSERKAPYGFVRNKTVFNVPLTYANQATEIVYSRAGIPEIPQKGRITVTKLDAETATTAQGDATLAGAAFDVFDSGGNRVERLYCGDKTSATTKDLKLGTYKVLEVSPPRGYTLSVKEYTVKIEYGDQDVLVQLLSTDLSNTVIKGRISLVKHSDDVDEKVSPPDPQVEKPLGGVVFDIYLKSAGSYQNAKPSERDRITTDSETGFCQTKLLPYGTYVVEEKAGSANEGKKIVAPFTVFISTDQKSYPYILSDPSLTAPVKILKTDSESGKQIPYAGAEFKVKNLDTGEWVKQSFNYPTPTTIDTYLTNEDGYLVMPENLRYNSKGYELWEVKAPFSYIRSKEPVFFRIDDPTGAMLTVTMKNAPAKGTVTIEKKGNMLTGVKVTDTELGKQYEPVFSLTNLAGAKFNIIAAENVYTGDGTLRYTKGQIVDTITTTSSGKTTSKPLYLGNFYCVEVSAPTDFVLDTKQYPFSLVYKDDQTEIVTEQIGALNIRQKISINLLKVMEKPVGAPDNYNPFEGVSFGLFARNDIKDVNGNITIPKDGLITVMYVDEKGKSNVTAELPFSDYYLKELSTNTAYQLDSKKEYSIKTEYIGQDASVSYIQVNNGGKITNELKLGTVSISKVGDMLTGVNRRVGKTEIVYEPVFSQTGLAGAEFDLIAGEDFYDVNGVLLIKKGTVVDHLVTGKDGTVTSIPVHLGRWILIETKAPEGFTLDKTPHEFTLGIDNLHEDVISKQIGLSNERQQFNLSLEKSMEKNSNFPQENPYESVRFGLFAAKDIKNADGEVIIKKDQMVQIIGLDQNGKYEGTLKLPLAQFQLKELQTAEGYLISNQVFDLDLSFRNQDTKTVDIKVNDGKAIVNELIKGEVKVFKTDNITKTPLEGVVFEVRNFKGETAATIITGKDGTASVNLPYGKYTIFEKSTLQSYILDKTVHEIEIKEHEKVYELELQNVKIRGYIRIFKYDGKNKAPIEGVVFGIYNEKGELIQKLTTKKDGYAISDLMEYGKYKIVELSTVNGFKLDQTPYELEITENDNVYDLSFKNERIPEQPGSPKTGDTGNVWLWITILGASTGVLAVTLTLSHKKRKNTGTH